MRPSICFAFSQSACASQNPAQRVTVDFRNRTDYESPQDDTGFEKLSQKCI
jgi:hypothetical protein